MTDNDKALACSGCGEYVGSHISDRIEAQAAEIERLREALWDIAHHTSVRTAKECWEEARAALGEKK